MTRDDPAAFAPPPAFGPFRVLHQIGIGALGPVFRTYEPTRDRLVAVKLLRLDITPEQAQALADELARACDAGLFHPSIVEPIAAGVEGTSAYRAEEYVAAESLDVAIRHYAPASVEKVLPFITQLAGAIDFARTAGVGHGGLHLRDVFVTPDEARASGFGIVESLERVGIRAPVRRPYSAPERIAGSGWSTPADIFSLAAIAYELLTGRRPSGTGDQIGAMAGDHVGGHAASIHGVLARAMDDDPARRYSTALAFASALEAAAREGVADRAVVPVTAPVARTAPAEPEPSIAPEPLIKPEPPIKPAPVAPPVVAATVPEPARVEPPKPDAVRRERVSQVPEDEPVAAAPLQSAPLQSAPLYPVADVGLRESDDSPLELFEPAEREPLVEPTPMRHGTLLDTGPVPVERTRVAILPIALAAVLCLAIGFAAGYALAGRERRDTAVPPVAATQPQPSSPQATSGQPQRSGQAWSEQSVAPPSASASSAPAAAPPAATRATLTVQSTPKNAPVTINGKWRGRTPLTLEDLPFGTYTLRIVQPGYMVARQVVTLTKAQPSRTVNLQLERPVVAAAPPRTAAPPANRGAATTGERYSGSLFVASNPTGAHVFVDGRPFGTAPARIPEVPIGSHVVRLELPSHRAWTTSVRVAAGQETRVAGSLEPIQ